MSDDFILDQIAEIREKNMQHWNQLMDLTGIGSPRESDTTMEILRVGLKYVPDDTRKILKEIHENDAAINRLTGLLVTRLITDKCLCMEDGTTNSGCPIHGMMA